MTCCLAGPCKLFIRYSLRDLAQVHIGIIFDVRSGLFLALNSGLWFAGLRASMSYSVNSYDCLLAEDVKNEYLRAPSVVAGGS